MKSERLLDSLGDIPDRYLMEALPKKHRSHWVHWLAAAACLALVLGVPHLIRPAQLPPAEPQASPITETNEKSVNEEPTSDQFSDSLELADTFGHIGPLTLGMTTEEVADLIGYADEVNRAGETKSANGSRIGWFYHAEDGDYRNSLCLGFVTENSVYRLYSIRYYGGHDWKTDRGLYPGAGEQEVKEALQQEDLDVSIAEGVDEDSVFADWQIRSGAFASGAYVENGIVTSLYLEYLPDEAGDDTAFSFDCSFNISSLTVYKRLREDYTWAIRYPDGKSTKYVETLLTIEELAEHEPCDCIDIPLVVLDLHNGTVITYRDPDHGQIHRVTDYDRFRVSLHENDEFVDGLEQIREIELPPDLDGYLRGLFL